MDGKEIKKKISALDVFVIAVLLFCIAALAVRLAVGREGVLPENAPESGDFALSFEAAGLRAGAVEALGAGATVYTEDGAVFGTLADSVSVTPAKLYHEDAEGRYVMTYSPSDGPDGGVVDVRGTLTVEGYFTDSGFIACGSLFASPNTVLILHTGDVTFEARIMDITGLGD